MTFDPSWVAFNEWSSKLVASALKNEKESFLSAFTSLNNNADRVKHCFNSMEFVNAIKDAYRKSTSSNSKVDDDFVECKKLYTQANSSLQKGYLHEAVELYSKVLNSYDGFDQSPPVMVSLTYLNRSAALFNLGYYESSLNDIETALFLKCPEKYWSTLAQRKVKCLISLKRSGSATDVIDEARKRNLSELVAKLEALDLKTSISNNEDNDDDEDAILSNDSVANAHLNLKLKSDEYKGRCVVSTANIPFGTVLIEENPFAHILHWDKLNQFCEQCCKKVNYGNTCFKCGVRYCSLSCFLEAQALHSRTNCSMYAQKLDIGIARLVLNIVSTTFPCTALDKWKRVEENPPVNYIDCYETICTLNDHQADIGYVENLQFIASSMFLYYLIKSNEIDDKQQVSFVTLLLKHHQQLMTNTISILEQLDIQGSTGFASSTEKEIGLGLYATSSLMNHSCEPNVVSFFEGRKLCIQAAVDLQPGSEVLFCYGPSHRQSSKKDRQKLLKENYFFECKCVACESYTDSKSHALLCSKCKGAFICNEDRSGSCSDCKAEYTMDASTLDNVRILIALGNDGHNLLEKNDLDLAIDKLSSSNNQLDSILHRHNISLIQIKDDLCKCLSLMGQHKFAYKYGVFNLNTFNQLYGGQSLQTVLESRKVCNLAWNFIEELIDEKSLDAAKLEATKIQGFFQQTLHLFTVKETEFNSCKDKAYIDFSNEAVKLRILNEKLCKLLE